MKQRLAGLAVLACGVAFLGHAAAQSVTTYHNGIDRHGVYVVPGLDAAAAGRMRLDPAFKGVVDGSVYAQPLYWQETADRPGQVIVATEANAVVGLDAERGTPVWRTQLPPPAPLSALGCGNIDPEGITGTPAIDPRNGVMYLDAVTDTPPAGVRHMIYALSAPTGAVLPGWPLDVRAALRARGIGFDPAIQGQRGAVLLLGGRVYVTFGGRWGDCGPYRGMVVEVTPSAVPAVTGAWATRAEQGGIWAQGGASSDGVALFVTTGNTTGARVWGDGEAVIRLRPGLARSDASADYFTPSNWRELDDQDADLGGTEALPLAVQGAGGQEHRVIAFGKDGRAYLLDGADLGGVGKAVAVVPVSNRPIITAPAVLQTASDAMVVFRNAGGRVCRGSSLSMLKVSAGGTPPVTEAWCAGLSGAGAPIVTTLQGGAEPIVWAVGAQGDGKLHGFDALSGRVVFGGGQEMSGLRHFETILAADRHLYVAATGRIYAFTYAR